MGQMSRVSVLERSNLIISHSVFFFPFLIASNPWAKAPFIHRASTVPNVILKLSLTKAGQKHKSLITNYTYLSSAP